jgi:hypothetical protein
VNVASFLADLGFRVAVTGLLGRDNAGVFEQLFAGKGMTDAFVRIPGKTRVNIKIIDETRRGSPTSTFPAPPRRPTTSPNWRGRSKPARRPRLLRAFRQRSRRRSRCLLPGPDPPPQGGGQASAARQ